MARNIMAGVANVDAFVGDQLIFSAKTLSTSGITISTTPEDVRGGMGNQLIARYYHDSTFELNLTDVLFKLEYLALQAGGTIENGAEMFTTEQVVIATNTGTLVGTPIPVDGALIGWVAPIGDDTWTKVEFTDNAGTVTFPYTADDGTALCVRYMHANVNARTFKISANIIPSEVKLVMTGSLFKAGQGATSSDLSGSSKTGVVEFIIPRFQFTGNMEFTMDASGVSNSQLSGSALMVEDPSCDSVAGYYAIVNEEIYGTDVYADLTALAIDGGSDVNLAVAATKKLVVYAIPKTGGSFIIDNSLLTFTTDDAATATADATGLITGVAAGTTTVDVALTSKPALNTSADVTVA